MSAKRPVSLLGGDLDQECAFSFALQFNSLLWKNNVKLWCPLCSLIVVDIFEDKTFIPQLFYHCHTIDFRTITAGNLQLQRVKVFHREV